MQRNVYILLPYIPSWYASYLIMSRRILEASFLLNKMFPVFRQFLAGKVDKPISAANSQSLHISIGNQMISSAIWNK